ncbi:MAG: hypothetical protein J0I14_10680 [Propionibacteriaceae bacterium]|jgi:hypothetical protein|nr:hypothetical protein [Propionibacteriaceae bacterium]
MALLDEVVGWAKLRPWWQQLLVLRLARGDVISDDDCDTMAAAMLGPVPPTPEGGWLAELNFVDPSAAERVRLIAVRDVENVNRLAPGQRLTFAPDGLTVVFGRNGSGKSGYARVIQAMVRTRKRSAILSDVFGPTRCETKAVVEYAVGDDPGDAALGDGAPVELSRVSFYDEKCGDDYLVAEAEPAFSPSVLRLLDDLAHACQRIREVLLVKLRALESPVTGCHNWREAHPRRTGCRRCPETPRTRRSRRTVWTTPRTRRALLTLTGRQLLSALWTPRLRRQGWKVSPSRFRVLRITSNSWSGSLARIARMRSAACGPTRRR